MSFEEVTAMGLRERKKQRTRTALVDAALDLFAAQGYEATTVDQIAAVVDVSPRTFFRYFSTKEDAALSLIADEYEIFMGELAARPDAESPFTALSQAMRSTLGVLRGLAPAEAERFVKVQELIQATPALVTGQMRLMMENERRLLAEVTRRQGGTTGDLAAQFVVSVFTALGMVCFGNCVQDPTNLAERFEALLTLAERSLRPGWDCPARRTAEAAPQ
jgi:AcrR family transcriptional regulator